MIIIMKLLIVIMNSIIVIMKSSKLTFSLDIRAGVHSLKIHVRVYVHNSRRRQSKSIGRRRVVCKVGHSIEIR